MTEAASSARANRVCVGKTVVLDPTGRRYSIRKREKAMSFRMKIDYSLFACYSFINEWLYYLTAMRTNEAYDIASLQRQRNHARDMKIL